jgi:hypothetical protein
MADLRRDNLKHHRKANLRGGGNRLLRASGMRGNRQRDSNRTQEALRFNFRERANARGSRVCDRLLNGSFIHETGV